MVIQNKCNFSCDLIFQCKDNEEFLNLFKIEKNDQIFQKHFWEEILICWISIVILEKRSKYKNKICMENNFSLSLNFVDDEEISCINKKWLDKSGATDVLSFPILCENLPIQKLALVELGDIFISIERAFQQSLDYEHSLQSEMLFLASHGLLHLFGWEHDNQKQLDSMLNFQQYLISKSTQNNN
tara:strand:- start:1124 stop:1678 length:555 start_codon:yes stop_codon:yes gene_type:complete